MSIVTDNIKTDSYLSKDGTREYGRCTAWVNFNGTGVPTIRDSMNVASITDNGVGNYTINFSISMADIGYSCTMLACQRSGDAAIATFSESYVFSRTINGITLKTFAGISALEDFSQVSVNIFGGDA